MIKLDKGFWKTFVPLAVIFGILYFSTIYIIIPSYLSTRFIQGESIGSVPILGYYNSSSDEIVILTDDIELREMVYEHESCHRDYYLKSNDANHEGGFWEEMKCYVKTL